MIALAGGGVLLWVGFWGVRQFLADRRDADFSDMAWAAALVAGVAFLGALVAFGLAACLLWGG